MPRSDSRRAPSEDGFYLAEPGRFEGLPQIGHLRVHRAHAPENAA
jgi:hypothetical protein